MENFINHDRMVGGLEQDKTVIKPNVNIEKYQSKQSRWENPFANYSDAQLQRMLAINYQDISDNDLQSMINKISTMSGKTKSKMFKPLKAGELTSLVNEEENIKAELALRQEIAARKVDQQRDE